MPNASNPQILWDNVLAYPGGTLTADENSAYPGSNVLDWRPGTPFRWKANSTSDARQIKIDAGAGNTPAPTCVAYAGHNLGTLGARVDAEWSDDGAAWTVALTGTAAADNLPKMELLTNASSRRYHRCVVRKPGGGSFSAVPEIGVLVLGVTLEIPVGVAPSLTPHNREAVVEESTAETGSPLGVNVRYVRRPLVIDYQEPGLHADKFWKLSTYPEFDDDFVPHAMTAGKPFFFAWNLTTDPSGVFLCSARDWRQEWVGSTSRRTWRTEFMGWRETG